MNMKHESPGPIQRNLRAKHEAPEFKAKIEAAHKAGKLMRRSTAERTGKNNPKLMAERMADNWLVVDDDVYADFIKGKKSAG